MIGGRALGRGWSLFVLLLLLPGVSQSSGVRSEGAPAARIELVPSVTTCGPGEEIRVDAFLSGPLDLRKYHLALDSEGGETGALVPVDARLDGTRADFVFAGTPHTPVVEPLRPGIAGSASRAVVTAPAGAYLGTFTFRPSHGARGEFRVRLCANDSALTDSFGNTLEPGSAQVTITVAGPAREASAGSLVPLELVTSVPLGSTWSYLHDGSDQGTAWREPDFDDADWDSGPGELGYGDGDEATVVEFGPDPDNKYVTTYLRHVFTVADVAGVTSLSLNVRRDDGVVVYLNGTEICRLGMPPGIISYDTLASVRATEADESTLFPCPAPDPGLLVEGENVLAAEIHQFEVISSDISFDLQLGADVLVGVPDAPLLVSPADGASGVSLDPELRVNVSDPDGGDLEVTFRGRPVDEVATPEDFTIMHVADMQYYARSYPATYRSITQWIRDNWVSRNMVFVDFSGDLVHNADELLQWSRSDDALSILEPPLLPDLLDGLPYGVNPGNHDQEPFGDPNGTQNYNLYYGLDRFCPEGVCRSYYGGSYNGIDNDNNYQLFSGAGMDFVVVRMEYDESANADVLTWADGILQTYSDRRAIVTSHYIMDVGEQGPFGDQGQAIYDEVMDRSNVFLMLAGHKHGEGKRVDPGAGGDIVTLIANYQDRPNGGNGWIRILEFSPANDEIRVSTYSPWLTVETCTAAQMTWVPGEGCFETDADSQFVLPYEMDAGPRFVELGRLNVPSGSDAFLIWPGLSPLSPYEWYVTVSDGTTTTNGPVWSFATHCELDGQCDDANFCTLDRCIDGSCEQIDDDGLVCDDDDPCTVADQCTGGSCAGAPLDCPAGMSCDPGSSQCVALLTEVSFREGVDGYAGTQDSFLREATPGAVNGDLEWFEWDDDDPNGDPVQQTIGLLRFDDIVGSATGQIPAGAHVLAADVTYTVNNGGNSGDFHEVLIDWDESDSSTGFCGESCEGGVEYEPGMVNAAPADTVGVHSVDVTESVQGWADDPTGNRGWIIFSTPGGTGGVELSSSEDDAVSARPELRVLYSLTEPCTLDTECDDGDTCTIDLCDLDYLTCRHSVPPIPREVRGLRVGRSSPGSSVAVISWSGDPAASSYNVYRAETADLHDLACLQGAVDGVSMQDDGAVPDPDGVFYLLATAVNCSGESQLGGERLESVACPGSGYLKGPRLRRRSMAFSQ